MILYVYTLFLRVITLDNIDKFDCVLIMQSFFNVDQILRQIFDEFLVVSSWKTL